MQAHKTPHSLNNYPVAKQHQQIEFSVALNFYNEKLLIRKNNMFCFSGLFMTYMHSLLYTCLLYTSPSPRDRTRSRMPSSA